MGSVLTVGQKANRHRELNMPELVIVAACNIYIEVYIKPSSNQNINAT